MTAKTITYHVSCRHCGAEYEHEQKRTHVPPGICEKCASRNIHVRPVPPPTTRTTP